MGNSVSCNPHQKADAEIIDKANTKSIQWSNSKQCKHYEESGENLTSGLVWEHQQVVNQDHLQEQIPALNKDHSGSIEKLHVVSVNDGYDRHNRDNDGYDRHTQQQVPDPEGPIQDQLKNLQQVYSVSLQNSNIAGSGIKFLQQSFVPKPVKPVLAVVPEVSTILETADVSVSEAVSVFKKELLLSSDEELVLTQNPALSSMWGMQFARESDLSESSDVEEEATVGYGDETSYEDVADYGFEGSSVLTEDIDAIPSDSSSIYGAFEDTILTDYKCYKYCLLDDDGLETKVYVKILKGLSKALLRKNGIIPKENPVLFGVDPCLKLQRVYDHGEDLYVVSDAVDLTLKDLLSEGYPELPLLAKIYITSELIRKFTILHAQGIYMNNFGSRSVLLGKDGRVYVNNFLESALQKLKHQLIAGTEYAEHLKLNPLSTDRLRKKDIYRLGQVIGRALVGNKFQQWLRDGDNIEVMLRAQNVPEPILQIICRCLGSRQEAVFMDEINNIASYFSSNDLCSGRLELQQYLNF